jgi:hypothetical protein
VVAVVGLGVLIAAAFIAFAIYVICIAIGVVILGSVVSK